MPLDKPGVAWVKEYPLELLWGVLIAATYIYQGSLGEIQSWDESLYAIRAQACLQFGAWVDQTPYAVGGLYSSAHPPLGVWLIALATSVFGDSSLAIRLPGILAAFASGTLMYFLGSRISTNRIGLIVAATYLVIPTVFWYGTHDKLDALAHAFALLSIWSHWKAVEESRRHFHFLGVLALALSLLSKGLIGLYVLPAFFVVVRPGDLRASRAILFSILASILLAIPWYGYMAWLHPGFVYHLSEGFRTLTTGEYSVASQSRWWYYFHFLLLNLPIGLLAFSRLRQQAQKRDHIWRWLILWFSIILIGLLLIQTRMPHFGMLLFAPLGLLLAHRFAEDRAVGKVGLAMTLFATGWSASEQVRLLIKGTLAYESVVVSTPALLVMILVTSTTVVVTSREPYRGSLRILTLLASLVITLHVGRVLAHRQESYIDGAKAVADTLERQSALHLEIYHKDYPNEGRIPQLGYYTNGWTLGWREHKTAEVETWEGKVSKHGDAAVVLLFGDRFFDKSRDTAVLNPLRRELTQRFTRRAEFKSYELYY